MVRPRRPSRSCSVRIWFSGLIGWAGNLSSPPEVIRHVTTAARLLLAGAAAERELPEPA